MKRSGLWVLWILFAYMGYCTHRIIGAVFAIELARWSVLGFYSLILAVVVFIALYVRADTTHHITLKRSSTSRSRNGIPLKKTDK